MKFHTKNFFCFVWFRSKRVLHVCAFKRWHRSLKKPSVLLIACTLSKPFDWFGCPFFYAPCVVYTDCKLYTLAMKWWSGTKVFLFKSPGIEAENFGLFCLSLTQRSTENILSNWIVFGIVLLFVLNHNNCESQSETRTWEWDLWEFWIISLSA